jgi:hypothetical protein
MTDDRLTALDGIAVFLTGLLTVVLVAFTFWVAPSFASMFRDFGNTSLPLLTRLALSRWFPLTLAATTAIGPALAYIPAIPLRVRRWTLVAAFVFGGAAAAVCLEGMYAPIFDLAGKVKAPPAW